MIRTLVLAMIAVGALSAADTPAAEVKVRPYTIDTCIVMGEKLDKDSPATVVEGQEFKVCCKGCIKKIQADPKGYLAKLAAAEKAAAAK
jgi:hypothetical protein